MIKEDKSGQQIYGSPDVLISREFLSIPISNFSNMPITISIGEVVGHAHNPRNWLDRPGHSAVETRKREAYAQFLKNIVEERGRAMKTDTATSDQTRIAGSAAITSSSEITSKAHRNATSPDDPAAEDPVEGGPKTAEVPPDPVARSDFLGSVGISPTLTSEQRQALENVLLENQSAFGLDGRLGNHDTQVEITLKPNATPVSLPPFPASPLNREVM
ncbi:hypothetical protein BDZ89DRAFT_953538, partial [Hymenopellis radicata]